MVCCSGTCAHACIYKLLYATCTCILYLYATDGPDYTSGLLTAVFRGSSSAVVSVPTLHDNIVEGEENFAAVILVPLDATMTYRVRSGTPATATVVINDDDSKFSSCMFPAIFMCILSIACHLMCMCIIFNYIFCTSPCWIIDLTVFFNSTFHSVPEGESQVLVLKADKPFEVSFIVIVTLVDVSAVGKWME